MIVDLFLGNRIARILLFILVFVSAFLGMRLKWKADGARENVAKQREKRARDAQKASEINHETINLSNDDLDVEFRRWVRPE